MRRYTENPCSDWMTLGVLAYSQGIFAAMAGDLISRAMGLRHAPKEDKPMTTKKPTERLLRHTKLPAPSAGHDPRFRAKEWLDELQGRTKRNIPLRLALLDFQEECYRWTLASYQDDMERLKRSAEEFRKTMPFAGRFERVKSGSRKGKRRVKTGMTDGLDRADRKLTAAKKEPRAAVRKRKAEAAS